MLNTARSRSRQILYFLAPRPHLVVPTLYLITVWAVTDFSAHMETGDSITTSRVALAGSIFDQHGLVAQRFKPSFYSPAWSNDLLQYYTHFPPLPYYYGWVVAKVGISPWGLLVAGFLMVAAATLGVWIRFASMWGGRSLGWVVAVALLLAPPTHSILPYNAHNWADLFVALFALATLAYLVSTLSSSKERMPWLSGTTALGMAGIGAFGTALSSFEYIPATAILAVGTPVAWMVGQAGPSLRSAIQAVRSRVRDLASIVGVALGGVLAAMTFHLTTNLWALGSIRAVVEDLRGAAAQRTAGSGFAEAFDGMLAFAAWVDDRIYEAYRVNWLLVAVALLFVVLVGVVGKQPLLLGVGILASVLWVASLAFNLVFRQWAWIHMHVIAIRHFIVPYAFTLAGGFMAIWYMARRWRWTARQPIVIVASTLVVLILGFSGVRSAQESTRFVSHAWELSMARELGDLRHLLTVAQQLGGERVVTDDNNLVRAAFLHHPRDYFALPHLLVDGFQPGQWPQVLIGHALPDICDEVVCTFVLTERVAGDESVVTACATTTCVRHGRWTVVSVPGVLAAGARA